MEKTTEAQNTAAKKKTSTSETGHAKNIDNFDFLISFCLSFGTIYNPSKESLTIAELQNQYQSAFDKLLGVKIAKVNFDNMTNCRRQEFDFLKPLSTRILNAFTVSGADKLAIDDLKSINRKIQGPDYRKQKKNAIAEGHKIISTSQQSYDRLMDHFANLLQILEQNPIYNPNENELKLTALQSRFLTMKTTNTNLVNAYTQYSNAMIERNEALYNALTGLVQTAKEVKLYVKSIYGAGSPQYSQISAIEFKMFKA